MVSSHGDEIGFSHGLLTATKIRGILWDVFLFFSFSFRLEAKVRAVLRFGLPMEAFGRGGRRRGVGFDGTHFDFTST